MARTLSRPLTPVLVSWGLVTVLLLRRGFPQALVLEAALVTALFALAARGLRAVDSYGALTGAAVAFTLYLAEGMPGFLVLLCLFLVTYAATTIGQNRKQALGVAERAAGRSGSQVLANLYPVLVILAFGHESMLDAPLSYYQGIFSVAAYAALAEVAADTVSSELGQVLAPRARLITTFRVVPAGTDGGISLPGTLAGLSAAAAISVSTPMLAAFPAGAVVVGLAGVAGMSLDSILGAVLERRRWLGNDMVNAISSGTAAVVAMLSAYLLYFG